MASSLTHLLTDFVPLLLCLRLFPNRLQKILHILCHLSHNAFSQSQPRKLHLYLPSSQAQSGWEGRMRIRVFFLPILSTVATSQFTPPPSIWKDYPPLLQPEDISHSSRDRPLRCWLVLCVNLTQTSVTGEKGAPSGKMFP